MAAKRAAWRELSRTELGLYASGHVSGPGWSNPGYFSIVYLISETRELERGGRTKTEFRERVEQGPACRHYREGYEAFVSLYQSYVHHARSHAGDHVEKHSQCFTKHEVAHPVSPSKARRAGTKKRSTR